MRLNTTVDPSVKTILKNIIRRAIHCTGFDLHRPSPGSYGSVHFPNLIVIRMRRPGTFWG
jgi:hypothetical protein